MGVVRGIVELHVDGCEVLIVDNECCWEVKGSSIKVPKMTAHGVEV